MPAPIAPAATQRRRTLRNWLKRLHLWLGLSLGSFYALIALSGSVLVLQEPLLCWTHPELRGRAQPAAAQRAAVLDRIEREWSSQGLRAAELPDDDLPVWQLYFRDGTRRYLAPISGDLLLTRRPGSDPLLTLRNWHTHLLAGRIGENVLGVIGWASLFMLLSGTVLWWPGRSRLAAHLRPYAQPPIRRWLTWHRSIGALALPLLLTVTLTGTLMAYHGATRSALRAIFGQGAAPSQPARIPPTDRAIDWQAVLDAAQRALPLAELRRITLPQPRDARVLIRARSPGEWNASGRSMVWLDPYTAQVLARSAVSPDNTAARVDGALYPIHSGTVGGWPWRLLAILCGLLPGFFLVTGFLFWRTRRRHAAQRP